MFIISIFLMSGEIKASLLEICPGLHANAKISNFAKNRKKSQNTKNLEKTSSPKELLFLRL